jgi:hypothetical protein
MLRTVWRSTALLTVIANWRYFCRSCSSLAHTGSHLAFKFCQLCQTNDARAWIHQDARARDGRGLPHPAGDAGGDADRRIFKINRVQIVRRSWVSAFAP